MPITAPISGLPRFDENGLMLRSAVAYFYVAGTTTPLTVYADPDLVELPWPVPVTGRGSFPIIYISGTGRYDIRILESAGGPVFEEIEDCPGEQTEGGGPDPGTGTVVPTGGLMARFGSGTVPEWVRANGRTIGSDTSGASERSDDDCQELFEHLWSADPNLVVIGGRGLTANADWLANKRLTLPDFRGRGPLGVDDMGNAAAGRLSGGLITNGSATAIGSFGGEAGHTLSAVSMPTHTHVATATTAGAGGHNHPGSTADAVGDHAHAYTITGEGAGVAYGGGAPGTTGLVQTSEDTYPGGAHDHDLTITAQADHTHTVTVTVETAGSGASHNNLSPFVLVTYYLKL